MIYNIDSSADSHIILLTLAPCQVLTMVPCHSLSVVTSHAIYIVATVLTASALPVASCSIESGTLPYVTLALHGVY